MTRIPSLLPLHRAALLLVLTACVLASAAAQAKPETLDEIVAIVNEDAVLASELRQRLSEVRQRLSRSDTQVPPAGELRKQVLERLIVETAQMQMAKRMNIQISDAEVNQALSRLAERNGMNLQRFKRALESQGRSWRSMRQRFRRDMIMHRLQQRVVGRRVQLSEQDVTNFLESKAGRLKLGGEYRLGHILIAAGEQGSGPSSEARARTKAEKLVERLAQGADFKQLAVAHSAGRQALEGGVLGWRKAARLPTLFADQALNMQVGEVAGPIQSPSGFHIIKLLDKRGGSRKTIQQVRARHLLLEPNAIRDDKASRALAQRLHERLAQGGDWAAIAREHSDDKSSALAGGDLGWISAEQRSRAFTEVLRATETGELSEPFKTPKGWHILEVVDRREKDIGEKAMRRKARRLLHQRQFEGALRSWLQEIRQEAYVDIKIEL